MKSKLLVLSLFLCNLIVFSQTNEDKKRILQKTNVKELLQISKAQKNNFFKNKKEANALAKKEGWETLLYTDNSFSELIRIDKNGNRIYYSTFNNGAGITARVNHLYNGGSLGLNIEGQNMIAGEWDGGAVRLSHELFTNRVTQMDIPLNISTHSTHVAGTIIGTDQVQGAAARGMAFKAGLNAYDWNNDMSEVSLEAANGLLISNHSYGYNPSFLDLHQFGKYNNDAQGFDNIMYNAPYYLFVAAAGNTRDDGININDGGYDLLTGHSCSKNSIVVAAVNEVTNYTGPSSVLMSYFSSWGPTDDGRIKPDISAKGVNTYSASGNYNSDYTTYSGTSMAAPSVTGTLLLLQQYYNELNNNFMRSSTLRGLALHSAREAGNSPGPDYEFGWGLLDAKKASDIIRDNGLTAYISEESLQNNNTYSITVNTIGTEPLMASICWTDPAGNPVANTIIDSNIPALVNDLDIRITQNSDTFYPWKLNPNNLSAPATTGNNTVDNIEKIQIDNPTGSYTITVTHKETLNNTQNFSLILSGISFKDFYITATNSELEVCDTELSATFNLQLSTINSFSDTVNLSTSNLPSGITTNFTPNSMTNSGDFDLVLSTLNTVVPGEYPFQIIGQSNTEVETFDAVLKILESTFSAPVLNAPINNATSVALDTTFEWQEDINAQNYLIEIATDINFVTVIENATIPQNSYQASDLENNTNYYWRIKPINICGAGAFSSPFNFTTVCEGPTNITISNILLDSVLISWTENSGGSSWEIEVVEFGNTPTGVGIPVSTNPYTLTGLNSSTNYEVYIRSNCGNTNYSSWEVSNTFQTAANFCSGDHFYDSGGASGNYSNLENNTTTIAPSLGFNSVTILFNSFSVEYGYDQLEIYNGPDITAPLLGIYTGGNNPGTFTSTHPTGSLTFRFSSDSSVVYSGWDATVICENITCPSPSNVQLTNNTASSVDLSWTPGSTENAWQIEFGPTGFTLGSGTLIPVTTNPFTLTGLSSNTDYDIYLRAICGTNPGDDDSSWTGPLHLSTLCDTLLSPWFDTVEQHSGTTVSDIENCWLSSPNNTPNQYRWDVSTYGTTPSTSTGPYSAHSGIRYFYTESSGYNQGDVAELYTPAIDISNLTIPQLSFYYHMYGYSMGSLHVDIWNNGNWNNDEIVITGQQHTTGNAAWTEQILLLNNYTGTIQIRFRGIRGTNYYSDMAIDDIQTIEAPTCPEPSNFQTNNSTTNSVDLSWTAGLTENNWQIEYGAIGFTQGTGTIVPTTSNPFTLTGLNSNTDYDVYLRANCGANPGDDDSVWVGPINFTTLISCPSPSNLQASNITLNSVDLNWTTGSTEASWQIEFGPTGFTLGSGTLIPVTTNPFTLTGLSTNTNYDVYLRANCGANPSDDDDDSTWHGAITLATLADFCSGDHFYDSGGEFGNYSNYENLTTTIAPSIGFNAVTVAFNSFQLEGCCDYLRIYDGPDTSATLLGTYFGVNTPETFTSTHPTGSLTFKFSSDGSVTYSGWDASVICENITCPSPSNLQAYNNTTNSIDLSWTAGSTENDWQIEYGPIGFTQGTGTIVPTTSNPFTLTGLSTNTAYDVYLRANCGANPGDDDSSWLDALTFQTQCGVITAPFTEHFNSHSMPTCWVESGSESWLFSTNAAYEASNAGDYTDGGTTNYAWIDASLPNGTGHISNLKTPWIDISSLNTPSVQYALYSNNTDDYMYNKIEVIVHESNGNTTTIQSLQGNTNGWQLFTFNLSDFTITDNLIKVEFIIEENSPGAPFYNDILIDDVVVDELTLSVDVFEIYNFTYYPNPIEDHLYMKANKNITSVKIYSILGQEIKAIKPEGSSDLTLNFSEFNTGTYFVKVEINNRVKIIKIIKK